MQRAFDVRTASPARLATERDRLSQALPSAGRMAENGISIWLMGVPAVQPEEIAKVLIDERVQRELRQTPVDAVALGRALQSASQGAGGRIYDALKQPHELMMFYRLQR
jgi:hypothetical protein